MKAAGVMQWTVRLETRMSAGEVRTTELATFSRPAVVSTLAGIGLVLSEIKKVHGDAAHCCHERSGRRSGR